MKTTLEELKEYNKDLEDMKTKKETKTRHQALCEFYSLLSDDDIINLISMARGRIFVWNPNDNTCYYLDDEVPVCRNGNSIQINLIEE
tara:strand:+ start:645 stop:908 length:264 start_codon:yes stop_codon:yes gene_type:complete